MNRKMILTGLLLWHVFLPVSAQNTANTRKMSSKTEIKNAGSKIGSAIKITSGPNKGKYGFIMHHIDLDNTANIINSIYEIK